MTNSPLEILTPALAAIPGVAAIALGGSRARGSAAPSSDFDIGLYYRRGAEPDPARVRVALNSLIDDPERAVVTEVGAWGPWIVGGAWLSVGGSKVDLLYRCLEAVEAVIRDCHAGKVRVDYQPGHPHGFSSAIWMGEVAHGAPLHDPEGVLARLEAMTQPYPGALREALIRRFLWEVPFSIENGETAIARGDPTHIAGCSYRALASMAQTLFALNRRYLVNEKGALTEAASFPITIPRLAQRAPFVWREIGNEAFSAALDELRAMDGELKRLAAEERLS